MFYYQWKPYVPVGVRRNRAKKKMESLRKKGVDIQPVEIDGRKIAKTFWGEAWCNHLESFSDFENRLPRGRTYVRNGSVCHLALSKGLVEAKVAGSELYSLSIKIKTLSSQKWADLKQRCRGQVGSLIELLQGKLSDNVMQVVTDRENGLFPLPGEISMKCDCPDWAVMCKHVAAAMYGVGARLDHKPGLLFALRGVDHDELIAADADAAVSAVVTRGKGKRLDEAGLADVFGVDIVGGNGDGDGVATSPVKKRSTAKRPAASPKVRTNTSNGAANGKTPTKATATKRKVKTPAKKAPPKTRSTAEAVAKPVKKKAVEKKSAKNRPGKAAKKTSAAAATTTLNDSANPPKSAPKKTSGKKTVAKKAAGKKVASKAKPAKKPTPKKPVAGKRPRKKPVVAN